MPRSGSFRSSSGETIAYDLYLLDGVESCAAVLMCQGLSGVKHLVLPDVGARLAASGFAAMAFDYRGYGDSEGEKGWVDPFARLQDAVDAFEFLRAQPFVRGKVGVYTLSLGGLMGYGLAAQRSDIACVNISSGPASGERVMRGLRSADEYVRFKKRLGLNAPSLCPSPADGSGDVYSDDLVSLQDLFPFPGAFKSSYDALKESPEGPHSSSIPPGETSYHLASGSSMVEFNLLPKLHEIKDIPFLVQHGSDDNVLPVEDAIEAYDALTTEKQMLIHPGYDHLGLDSGPGFELQVGKAVEFFQKHLGR